MKGPILIQGAMDVETDWLVSRLEAREETVTGGFRFWRGRCRAQHISGKVHPHIQAGKGHQHSLKDAQGLEPAPLHKPRPHRPRREGGAGVSRGKGERVVLYHQMGEPLHHQPGPGPAHQVLEDHVRAQQTQQPVSYTHLTLPTTERV